MPTEHGTYTEKYLNVVVFIRDAWCRQGFSYCTLKLLSSGIDEFSPQLSKLGLKTKHQQ